MPQALNAAIERGHNAVDGAPGGWPAVHSADLPTQLLARTDEAIK
jgi:hypothetical protein